MWLRQMALLRGVLISNNNSDGVWRLCADYIPFANASNNSLIAASHQVIAAESVKLISGGEDYEYSNINPSFSRGWGNATDGVATNCVGGIDTSIGYDDNRSLKITISDAGNSFQLATYFSTPAASTGNYCAATLFVKSDTDQKLTLTFASNSAWSGVPLKGDGKWYAVSGILATNKTFPAGATYWTLASDAASGNLWVDCVSLKWFKSHQAAINYVGCLDKSAVQKKRNGSLGTAFYGDFHTNHISGEAVTWNTNQGSSQAFGAVIGTWEGRQLNIILGDVNSYFTKWKSEPRNLYTYSTAAGWSCIFTCDHWIRLFQGCRCCR